MRAALSAWHSHVRAKREHAAANEAKIRLFQQRIAAGRKAAALTGLHDNVARKRYNISHKRVDCK